MAVLEKIRVKLGILITILIAVALLSFIIDPNTLGTTMQNMSSENNVGKMNGKKINYREYMKVLDQYTSLRKATSQDENGLNSEEAQSQLRDITWRHFFNERVMFPKINDAGFSIDTDEWIDLMQGDHVSPVVSQSGMFSSNGMFSPEAVKSFIEQMPAEENGPARLYWQYLKEQAYTNQMYNKYYAALSNSATLNALQVNRMTADDNTTKSIDFIAIPVNPDADSTIKISSDEVNRYYKNHKKEYFQRETRDIEYALFEIVPSEEDIAATREVFDDLYNQFAEAENIKAFITRNTLAWDDTYYSKADLARYPAIAEFAFGSNAVISPVDSTAEAFTAVRVADRKMMPDSVNFSVAFFAAEDRAKADSLMNAVRKSGNSEEFVSYGWATMQDLVSRGWTIFSDVFSMKQGEVRLVEITEPGYQMLAVMKVDQTTKPQEKVQLATLRKAIKPSDDTIDEFDLKAIALVDKSEGNYDKFVQICKEESVPLIPAELQLETNRIGYVDNARSVVHWAFNKKTKEGSVSDRIKVDNYLFVAALTKVHKEGTKPLEEVKDDILLALIREKKAEKQTAEAAEKVSGGESLEQLAEKFNTVVSHTNGISFNLLDMNDPVLVGAVAAAKDGVVTGPIKGNGLIYFFKVTESTVGEYTTEQDVITKNAQITAAQLGALVQTAAEEADTKDYRAKFY